MVKLDTYIFDFINPEGTHNANVKKITKNIKIIEYFAQIIIFRTNPFGNVRVLFEHMSASTDFQCFLVKQYCFTKRLEKSYIYTFLPLGTDK